MTAETLAPDAAVALDGEAPQEVGEFPAYDFRRPLRVGPDQRRQVHALYDNLAETLEAWLSAKLREDVVIKVETLDTMSLGEILAELPNPCAAFHYEVEGFEAQTLVEIGADFAFACVDRLLGGSRDVTTFKRGLSALEQRVVAIVADRISESARQAWRDHVPFALASSGFEALPELIEIGEPEEAMLTACLLISTGAWESRIRVSIPFATVEAFFIPRKRGTTTMPEIVKDPRARIEATLMCSSVPIDVRFPSFELPLGVLQNMEPGMVLATRIPTGSSLEVSICGQRRFLGAAGRVGSDLAVRITEATPIDPTV